MQSRMDKYNNSQATYKSRTQRNQELYEDVKNSSLTNFDVNSNVSVLDTNADSIDVNELSHILDEKYNEYAPKRRSIEVPEYDEPIIEQPLLDTKEYDINAVLEKAKQGKNVDYNKERLKKVREAQYEILNNLDLELKKVDDSKKNSQRKAEEDNLMNLINTITELEIKNKKEYTNKETAGALELLNDLSEDAPDIPPEDLTEPQKEIKEAEPVEIKPEKNTSKQESSVNEEKSRDEKIEKTLSKLDINLSSYEDFSDVSKRDTATIVIKVVIFIIIIALVIGAVYILNILLDLGLF